MIFTEEDKRKIESWIKERCPQLQCFCCGSQRWELQDRAAMTVMFDVHSGRIHYMDGYPLVGLICKYCAYVSWFSAPMIGLKPTVKRGEYQK